MGGLQAYNPWFNLAANCALYQCAQCTYNTSNYHFCPACFQRWGDSRRREQFVWGWFCSLMGAGGHTRSEVEYMHKRRAESILTDFQIWQTVAVQKRPKPRAAVVFWARQLIVQCGLYCNIGKLVLLPMKLSCSSIGWRSSGEVRLCLDEFVSAKWRPSCFAFRVNFSFYCA